MTKTVDKPSNFRSDSEFFFYELVSEHHIVNNVLVVGTSLIVCTPASIEEFESAFFNELFDQVLGLLSLTSVPHWEELHLDVAELSVWSSSHLINHWVEYYPYCCVLIFLVRSSEILINCFKPSQIIMSVGNHMNIDLFVLIFSVHLNKVLSLFINFLLLYLHYSLLVFIIPTSVLCPWIPFLIICKSKGREVLIWG
jgi:hypothetical protein